MQSVQTNQALFKWIHAGAGCSVFAHDHEAQFYRLMIERCPFVLDALLESSNTDDHFSGS